MSAAKKVSQNHGATDKRAANDVVPSRSELPNVRIFEFGDAEAALANSLGVSVTGNQADRISSAVDKTNSALRLVVEAGLALLSVRAECEHGRFLEMLTDRGMPPQRAYEAMTYAKFAAGLSDGDRDRVLALHKTKVLELAKADPEVLQDLFEDDAKFDELTALSVRDLRVALRDANAKKTDLATRNEALERERDRLQEELRVLREGRVKTGGDVPAVVQDSRVDVTATWAGSGDERLALRTTPDTAATRSAIELELRDLFFREAVPHGRIPHTHLREAVSTAPGEFDHVFVQPTLTEGGFLVAGAFQILVLRSVAFQ